MNMYHKAIVTMKNHLEQHGQLDGRKLVDDFYASPRGWSKDTKRYLTAAMLVAGEIKLRISGEDVTVRGEAAVNALKNTNNFNNIGVVLRDGRPPAEYLLRAAERLLELTGETVLPFEEDVSKHVMKHFPDFQQSYAALSVKLETLGLPGEERAQSIQERIAEILKGDASDATSRLGGEDCPLCDDLLWAREVKKAFDNGIDTLIKTINKLSTEIPALPAAGIPGHLITTTQVWREELRELLSRGDFYKDLPALQNRVVEIETAVRDAAKSFAEEQTRCLESEKIRLQSLPEWTRLGIEEKARLGGELDELKVEGAQDFRGLKKLVANEFVLGKQLARIESEIRELGKEQIKEEREEFALTIDIELPRSFSSREEVDTFILKLQQLKDELKPGSKIKVNWQ